MQPPVGGYGDVHEEDVVGVDAGGEGDGPRGGFDEVGAAQHLEGAAVEDTGVAEVGGDGVGLDGPEHPHFVGVDVEQAFAAGSVVEESDGGGGLVDAGADFPKR